MILSRSEKLVSAALLLALGAALATYFINPVHAHSWDPRARVLGFMVYRIPSRSMLPTFGVGSIVTVSTAALARRDPHRGEIVVFQYPLNPDVMYIKRVIALGGETVEVRDGQVYVDGKPLSEPYLPAVPVEARPAEDFSARRVAAGEFFVLGDNRNNSMDSRSWGTVPRALMLGTVTPPEH